MPLDLVVSEFFKVCSFHDVAASSSFLVDGFLFCLID